MFQRGRYCGVCRWEWNIQKNLIVTMVLWYSVLSVCFGLPMKSYSHLFKNFKDEFKNPFCCYERSGKILLQRNGAID